MKKAASICAAVTMLAVGSSWADESKNEPYTYMGTVRFEKLNTNIDLNADGTFTQTNEVVLKVLKEEGIRFANQANISYSESLEDVTVLSAQTLKGNSILPIPVPPENIQDRAAIAGGGPMFSDIKTKVLIFPQVAVGDRVSYTYKNVEKSAIFPGHFSFAEVFSDALAYDEAKVTITVPVNSLDLKVFATGVEGGALKDKDGRKRWSWTYRNSNVVLPESGAVAPMEYAPHILVSSFKDFGAIAAAYQQRAAPKSKVTDKVRSMAEDVTRDIKDPRRQIETLSRWVSRNIHYAGNCIGIGSVVPHDVDSILDNRLGDCKDHAALLQALLAAKGVESTPALINSGTMFTLPEIPVYQVFNHVITYIPSFKIYVDSTADFVPFGLLPMAEAGKPTIHTAPFDGIARTPQLDSEQMVSHQQTTLRFHSDGSADGETSNQESGLFAVGLRSSMATLEPNAEDRIARSIISKSGYTGTGSISKADPHESPDPYTYGMTYHLDNVLELPGPSAIHVPEVFRSAWPVAASAALANQAKRTRNFGCFGGISSEDYRLEFPSDVKISAIPRDVHLTGGMAKYDATYKLDGQVVIVHRQVSDTASGECKPADDESFRPLAQAILKDLRAQILYAQ